tara:strand:+ start:426 stop:611 length:186 start_codon:yes stop_codon:yes gene_type:complete
MNIYEPCECWDKAHKEPNYRCTICGTGYKAICGPNYNTLGLSEDDPIITDDDINAEINRTT